VCIEHLLILEPLIRAGFDAFVAQNVVIQDHVGMAMKVMAEVVELDLVMIHWDMTFSVM